MMDPEYDMMQREQHADLMKKLDNIAAWLGVLCVVSFAGLVLLVVKQ